jgi:hypothetical protein
MLYPYSLRIPHTLALNSVLSKGPVKTYGFVAEFDCEIEIDYEDPDNWEITGLRFEQTKWNPEFTITPKSDPAFWALIDRALKLEDKEIAAKAVERMYEAWEDRQNQRCDEAHDRYVDSMLETNR